MKLNRQMVKITLILLIPVILTLFSGEKVSARQLFMIERPKLGISLSSWFRKDIISTPDTQRKDTSIVYSERLVIDTGGWIYHPALITYRLRLSPEWEQKYEMFQGAEKFKSGIFIQGYDTKLTFFQYKPYTLDIFAKRILTRFHNSFAGSSESEQDTYGASLSLQYSTLPARLDYRRTETSQSGFSSTVRTYEEFKLSMSHEKNMSRTRLMSSYKINSQTTMGSLVRTKQKKINLLHWLKLAKNKRLTTNMLFENTTGNFTKHTIYIVNENLYWPYRKNLTTNYSLSYKTSTFNGNKRDSGFARFNLSHLLYENLRTTITANGSMDQFSDGRTIDYGTGIALDYSRRIPWGLFSLSTAQQFSVIDRETATNLLQIIDEPIILSDGQITLLENETVDIDSIVITDTTGTIVYLKNIDYKITKIETFIRISKFIGGSIADGQEVLVDYRYLSGPAFDYHTYSQSYGINLTLWNVWNIFYRFNHLKQFLSGQKPSLERLADNSGHSAGTSLKWKWSTTSFVFTDNQTTTTLSTRSWRASESVTLRFSDRLFLMLFGSYGETEFKDTGETETFSAIRGNLQVLVSRLSRLSFEGFQKNISGQFEKTTDTGFVSTFEWRYRIYNGSIGYRFLHEKDTINSVSDTNHSVFVRLSRALF